MEQLTTEEQGEIEMICRFEDCDTAEDYCPYLNKSKCICLQNILEKLREYEYLEKNNLLLKLDFAIGSIAYILRYHDVYERHILYEVEIKEISYVTYHDKKLVQYEVECTSFYGRRYKYYEDEIGEFIFSTKEEAEQALQNMD